MYSLSVLDLYTVISDLFVIRGAFLKGTLYSPQKLEARDSQRSVLAEDQQHSELPEQLGHVTGWEALKGLMVFGVSGS